MEMRKYTKVEETNNKTICMWMEGGNNTGCPWDLQIGEWFWSESLSKMFLCFRDVVVADTIKAFFEIETNFDDEEEERDLEGNDMYSVITLASLSVKSKSKKEKLKKIKERLISKPLDFEQFNDMIMDVCEVFKSMNIPVNVTLVKGFGNCIPMLMAHDMYDPKKSGKEMLENDYFF